MALFAAIRLRKHVEWRLLAAPILGYTVIIFFTVWLSSVSPDAILRKLLGCFLIAMAVYSTAMAGKIKIKPSFRNGVIAGSAGGVLSGLFSAGGAPIAIYMLPASKENQTYIANMQMYFTFTAGIALTTRCLNGQVTGEALSYTAVVVVMIILGIALGSKIFNKLNADNLRKAVYVAIGLSGLLLIFK